MGWKFWKSEKSEAELSLEGLRAGAEAATRARATPASGPTTQAPAPEPGARGDFWMTVEDVFSITGRGTVVTGRVAAGTVRVGMPVTILTANRQLSSKVTGIEMFRKTLDTATVGDNVGLLLAQVSSSQLGPGDTITS